MIDIIIPAYNSQNTIEKTLLSICSQDLSEQFKVYICNDASKEDYSKIVNKFKKFIDIKELKLEKNSGPGAARQLGLDNSNSEFVVFIDADDQFYTPLSIKTMYNFINDEESDLVVGTFLEETENDYITHSEDNTWLHGKMYRRSFIDKYKIKFSNTYANEDNYFNKLFYMRNPKITYLNDIVYLWKYNKNSITRRNNREYKVTGLIGFIDNLTGVINETRKTELEPEVIANYTFSFMIAIYMYYLEYYDNKLASTFIEKSAELKNYFDEYYGIFSNNFDEIYKNQVNAFSAEEDYIRIIKPVITFEDFLKLYKE